MTETPSPPPNDKNYLQTAIGYLIDSSFIAWLSNLPPIAWITRKIVQKALKNRVLETLSQDIKINLSGSINLEENLQNIVFDVVNAHGYVGAMLATYEQGDSLPVRAFFVDPNIINIQEIYSIEREVSKFTSSPVSITDPDIACVNRYNPKHSENLSVRAVDSGIPIVSDHLYDLMRPIAPIASQQVIRAFQESFGIQQVIAVPFFLETVQNGEKKQEVVGNLFAAKRGQISQKDILVLSAFGRQASAAIEAERRRLQSKVAQDLVYSLQTSLQNEGQILQFIVEGIVNDLGFVGAMVGTYENDESISVQGFYINPRVASMEDIHAMEADVSRFTARPISITDPDLARVYTNREDHRDNLAVLAVEAGEPITSDQLYDLFRPIVPDSGHQTIRSIQETLGIQQVIAVPFFLEMMTAGKLQKRVIGNLFAASRSQEFNQGEIEILEAFGQQAAAGIYNARLYRKAEGRRQVAETFGHMAFSTAAYLHDLRNNIGIFKNYLEVLQRLVGQHQFQEQNLPLLRDMLTTNPDIIARMDATIQILDSLNEPWKKIDDQPTDINDCIERSIKKGMSTLTIYYIDIDKSLSDDLPPINTSPNMLTEAFSVIIKNAAEAIEAKGKDKERKIRITSQLNDGLIEVAVQDNGIGMKPDTLSRIFELDFSTKDADMGFGLYWAKDYLEGIEGELRVESIYGSGTTVTILIPTKKHGPEQ